MALIKFRGKPLSGYNILVRIASIYDYRPSNRPVYRSSPLRLLGVLHMDTVLPS